MQTLQVDVGHTRYPISIGPGLLSNAAYLSAILPNGDLNWYRHDGRADGSFRWAFDAGKKVVFACGSPYEHDVYNTKDLSLAATLPSNTDLIRPKRADDLHQRRVSTDLQLVHTKEVTSDLAGRPLA